MSSVYVPLICVYAMLVMVLVEINEPAQQIDCVEPIEQIEQCDTVAKEIIEQQIKDNQ